MSRNCTKQHQYSLCASPTKGRKTRRQKSNKVDETEPTPCLIHHTLKVQSMPMPEPAMGRKKPSRNTTLKRKREIRDALKANNDGYSDDFFDSTPVRRRKPFKHPVTDILIKDPEVDDENDSRLCHHMPFHGNNCSTPVNIHYLFASPPTLSASVERKNADVIVLRMQKSKRYRKYVCRAAPKASTVTRSDKKISGNLFDNAMKEDSGNLSSEDDSYFSNTE